MSFIQPYEIHKRSFSVGNDDIKIWFWYRWRETGINWVDKYLQEIQNLSKVPLYSGGEEHFENVKFKQIRGSYIVKLTNKALSDKNEKKKTAHTRVEKYLLENDPHTIAVEVPVWSYSKGLSGFIDVLRVTDFPEEKIQILDFKPNNSEHGVGEQLQRYRTLLSERMMIPRQEIDIGYFSEKGFYIERKEEEI